MIIALRFALISIYMVIDKSIIEIFDSYGVI